MIEKSLENLTFVVFQTVGAGLMTLGQATLFHFAFYLFQIARTVGIAYFASFAMPQKRRTCFAISPATTDFRDAANGNHPLIFMAVSLD